MKKLITICFALLCHNAFAQDLITKKDGTDIQEKVWEVTTNEGITPNMKYEQLKYIYNYKEYEETLFDRYNPALAGVASFFLPGLGQIISGEVGRGFAYLGGHVGGMILAPVIMAAGKGAYGYGSTEAALAALAIYAGVITLDICAIVDAVRVAKVKNMYEQDLRKHYAIDVDLYPSVNFVQLGNNIRPTAGLTLAIKF
ncbi:MAG: hypothetical protein ACTTGX_00385 [Candidatus Cryptobacteroides sp.]|jgi:TM2 domain.